MDDSLPARAHRVAVFGSTRSIAATAAGVRRRLSGLIWVLTTAGPFTLGGNGVVTERDDTLTLLTDTLLSQDVMSPSVLLAFWLASEEIPSASGDVPVSRTLGAGQRFTAGAAGRTARRGGFAQ